MFKRITITSAFLLTLTVMTTASAEAQTASRQMVTAEQIYLSGGSTVFDGFQVLRSRGVTVRTTSSIQAGQRIPPVLYLDGARLESLDILRSIGYADLDSLVYLDADDATLRYGTGHMGGAIIVRTKRG